jgi:hypothetical protein
VEASPLRSYLQLCHERLDRCQEYHSILVSDRLLVEVLLESFEQCIELLRFDDWPRDNGEVVLVQPSDEVRALFHLNDLLELELKSEVRLVVILQ